MLHSEGFGKTQIYPRLLCDKWIAYFQVQLNTEAHKWNLSVIGFMKTPNWEATEKDSRPRKPVAGVGLPSCAYQSGYQPVTDPLTWGIRWGKRKALSPGMETQSCVCSRNFIMPLTQKRIKLVFRYIFLPF